MNKLRFQLAGWAFVVLAMVVNTNTVHAGTCVRGGQVYDGNGGPWTAAGSPYFLDRVTVAVPDGKTLTIEPGVVVLVKGSSIEVRGTLIAQGVVFTGLGGYDPKTCSGTESRVPGTWGGIQFISPDPGCLLDGCQIIYGGGMTSSSMVSMGDNNVLNTNLLIKNCFIAYSAGQGVFLSNFSSPTILNTTFQNNATGGIYEGTDRCDAIVQNCTFVGNGSLSGVGSQKYPIVTFAGNVKNHTNLFIQGNAVDAIWVWGFGVFSVVDEVTTGTWWDHGVPYHVLSHAGNITVAARNTLTLEPGVQIQFGEGRGFSVLGGLIADGDSCRRITFTKIDTARTAPHWGTIQLLNSNPGSVLDYCDINYGGRGNSPSLQLSNVGTNTTVSNCRITNSDSTGISLSGTSSPLIVNNLISNNGARGLDVGASSGFKAVLRNNLITNNGEGIRVFGERGKVDLGTLLNPGHNAFVNNIGRELRIFSRDTISAIGNYWVDTDSAVIDQLHIFDNDESASSGRVILNPVDLTNQSRPPQSILCAPSCAALSITIASPTAAPIYQTTSRYLTLAGTATDDRGVAGIIWANLTTGASGAAMLGPSRRNLTWSAPGILLNPGQNSVVVTASDGDGCTASDQITVTFVGGVGCWEEGSFNNLNLGSLAGQNGWVTVPGRASVSVIADTTGPGRVLLMDAPANSVAIMEKDVPDQANGRHTLELLVRAEPSDTSMAKIEVKTTANPNWDKKFQLYFGTSMRLNYGPTQPEAIIFLPRVEAQRWYHVRAEIDLDNNLVDLFLDGAQVLSDVVIGAGPITQLSISAFDYPGSVIFDDIRGCQVIPVAVDSKNETHVITDYQLDQNYPNPFNPGTLIKYQIPQARQVVVKVYNSIGQEVRTLVNKVQPPGSYQITWDSRDERGQVVPSGIYFYRLEAGSFVQTRKITLLR